MTIPRFFKDIVVTEYGVVDIRDSTDEETIAVILNITDSRFQDQLLEQAKRAGKIDKNYAISSRISEQFP